jgi:hypothetical protein
MFALRPYQRQALHALDVYWRNGGGHPLISMATATGKSLVIAWLIRDLMQQCPDLRILAIGKRNLVIVDEAHLVPHDGDGMYRSLLDDLHQLDPEMPPRPFDLSRLHQLVKDALDLPGFQPAANVHLNIPRLQNASATDQIKELCRHLAALVLR